METTFNCFFFPFAVTRNPRDNYRITTRQLFCIVSIHRSKTFVINCIEPLHANSNSKFFTIRSLYASIKRINITQKIERQKTQLKKNTPYKLSYIFCSLLKRLCVFFEFYFLHHICSNVLI